MMRTFTSSIEPFKERKLQLLDKLRVKPQGKEWCRQFSDLADEAIQSVVRAAKQTLGDLPPISIVATGGYGRQELAPHSDLDLAVIPLHEGRPVLDDLIRFLYRGIHEVLDGAFNAEIGYAYRLVSDAPGLDGKSRSSMLDARLVAGSPDPLAAFDALFKDTFPTGDFLLDKVMERLAAMSRTNDTPLVVEPHLKEGAGGLRCHHAANWIRSAVGLQPLPAGPAFEAVLAARNQLHLVSGKKVDLLSRQRQAEIAEAFDLDLDEWLSGLIEQLYHLHEEFYQAEKLLGTAAYSLLPGIRATRGRVQIESGIDLGEAALGVALASGLGLQVQPGKFRVENSVDGPDVMRAVATGEACIREMDRSGLLAVLLPEFIRCRTLMPEDATHTYSVFEHTLRAVRHLDAFDDDPFFGGLKQGLADLGPLYLAVLLHDAGKRIDDRPHSEAGAEIAAEVCRRWKLASSASKLVEWLVLEHLTLARFIRMRDIHHPQTATELAEIVGTSERLDMLALLTAADIQAVSADAWSPAQQNMLQELWTRTAEVLELSLPVEHDPAIYRKRLRTALMDPRVHAPESPTDEPAPADTDAEAVEGFLASMPAHYLVSTPADVVRLHLSFVQKAVQGQPTIEVSHFAQLGYTDLTVACLDAPGLLSKLLGVLYAWDLSVQVIRASTTRSDPAVALDTFTVSFNRKPLPSSTCRHATADLMRVIQGESSVEEVLARRSKDPLRKQEHFSLTFIEGETGILEVRAPRGRGMAFRMARLISQRGWQIVSARIGQWAGQGAAAFYITRPDGGPLTADEVQAAFR